MTDVTPPTDPPGPSGELTGAGAELTPEELACGFLDGELAPADRARVEADPELMALVDRLRAVSDAVAAPVEPLAEDRRAAMLAAALAAAPAGAEAGATASGSSVVSLDQARARRSGRAARAVGGALAAAAAVGLVALFVARDTGGDDTDTADGGSATVAALDAGADRSDEASEAASAENAPADSLAADAAAADTTSAPATEAPAAAAGEDATSAAPAVTTAAAAGGASALPDLGPLANRQAARAATSDFAFVAVPAAPGDGPCAGYPPPVATATFQGVPAYVVIIEAEPSGNRLAFVDQMSCAVLVKVDPANA
jgi:hypothetical protein